MTVLDLDIVVTRGRHVESRHAVHAAVIDATGRTIAAAGNGDTIAHWRSCAKPFQVHPFLVDGTWTTLGWDDRRLALACASHGGEPEHVALAESMLASVGLDAGALACGPHLPLAERGAAVLATEGRAPTRLHNNCSGKHAAMLAACTVHGWPTIGYDEPSHPLQRRIRASLPAFTAVAAEDIAIATDGCGVPVFVLPLRAMATAWAGSTASPSAIGSSASRSRSPTAPRAHSIPPCSGCCNGSTHCRPRSRPRSPRSSSRPCATRAMRSWARSDRPRETRRA